MIVPDDPGRRPQTPGGVVYLLVLATTGVGLGIVVTGPWRTGVGWIGAGLLLAALARGVLPDRRAGMLRVRRKYVDAAMLALTGTAMIVLAVIIPDQPGP